VNQFTGQIECPHCQESLRAFSLPDDAGFDGDFQLACFNDECPYYVRGWEWMQEKYGVKASYRYRVNPEGAGKASPLAVWSEDALKDRIIEIAVAAPGDGEEEVSET